ncbi:MAG: UPF0262 family protein [Alphaproteobacteria bacterium]|jgi:uncharacterized protein (UPF0262 family)
MAEENRIAEIGLDDALGGRLRPEMERDRAVAIQDLIDENSFRLIEGPIGPYRVELGVDGGRLLVRARPLASDETVVFGLALSPFRRIIKDYHIICESYFDAIRTLTPMQIEAIDMGRRGLHNEGADKLQERLEGRAEIDTGTARRLFTLLCVLHARG